MDRPVWHCSGMQHQRGSVAVWTAVGIPAFVIALGIGVDFAGHAAATQEAQAVASEAARAAGQQVNLSGAQARIDAPLAMRAAQDYLAASPFTGAASVRAEGVTVNVTGSYHCQFLSIVGIETLDVSGLASSQAYSVEPG